jgi:hypothetical protein
LYFGADDMTLFTVCKDDLKRLTANDKILMDAVRFGVIQLSAMPRHLYGDDHTQDRVAWLRSEVEAFKQSLPDDIPDIASL